MKLGLYLAAAFFGLQAMPSLAQSFAAPPPQSTAPPPQTAPPPTNSPPVMSESPPMNSVPVISSMPVVPPPALPTFAGVPIKKIHPIVEQRHQALTLLYREALEVLKQDPGAADIPECPGGDPAPGEICMRTKKKADKASTTQKSGDAKKQEDKKAAALAAIKKDVPVPEADKIVPAPVEARKVAILFGNNAYTDQVPPLETPIADVQEIGKILHDRFGYDVRIVRDAKKADMVTALNQIGYETKFGDSVMVAYAGHGYLMDSTKMGYWIPVDGTAKSPANWVSNSDITKFLKNIPAKQIILISDSCYSGTLTKEEKITSATKIDDREEVLTRRSVLTMSSGGDEPVTDEGKDGHSIFAWSMINALKSLNATTPGAQIFQKVKKEVLKEYPQEPQYGAVLSAGHKVGGDYFFEAPKK